jgi:hypothetical protein
MVEELSERWGKFTLDDDESMGVALDGEDIAPLVQKGKKCLIGKLLADRIVPKVHLRAPLLRIGIPEVWYLSKLLVFYVGYVLDDKNTLYNGCFLRG